MDILNKTQYLLNNFFFLRSERRQKCLLLTPVFNIPLEVSTDAIRQEEEMKSIQIKNKEMKWFVFPDDMIVYRKIPMYRKESPRTEDFFMSSAT